MQVRMIEVNSIEELEQLLGGTPGVSSGTGEGTPEERVERTLQNQKMEEDLPEGKQLFMVPVISVICSVGTIGILRDIGEKPEDFKLTLKENALLADKGREAFLEAIRTAEPGMVDMDNHIFYDVPIQAGALKQGDSLPSEAISSVCKLSARQFREKLEEFGSSRHTALSGPTLKDAIYAVMEDEVSEDEDKEEDADLIDKVMQASGETV